MEGTFKNNWLLLTFWVVSLIKFYFGNKYIPHMKTVNEIKKKQLSFKRIFPIHFTVKTFLEIIQLTTHVLFDDLYCSVHPTPFIFLGGLQSGIWILWSFRIEIIWEILYCSLGRGGLQEVGVSFTLNCVWGVVEGRMLIKIINNCWKEKWITTLLSDRRAKVMRRPPCRKRCKGDHETCGLNFSPGG